MGTTTVLPITKAAHIGRNMYNIIMSCNPPELALLNYIIIAIIDWPSPLTERVALLESVLDIRRYWTASVILAHLRLLMLV